LQAFGFTTIAKLKEVEKPGKLANDLNGYISGKNGIEGIEPGGGVKCGEIFSPPGCLLPHNIPWASPTVIQI